MPVFRNFTEGITFYVSRQMRTELDKLSEDRRQAVSEILRSIIEDYLTKGTLTTTDSRR
jgi:predicted DNA-binding protein